MVDKARHLDHEAPHDRPVPKPDPFGLRAYVARDIAERQASGAPTVAEWFAQLDAIRAKYPDVPSYEPGRAADEIRAAREERDAHLDSLWQR